MRRVRRKKTWDEEERRVDTTRRIRGRHKGRCEKKRRGGVIVKATAGASQKVLSLNWPLAVRRTAVLLHPLSKFQSSAGEKTCCHCISDAAAAWITFGHSKLPIKYFTMGQAVTVLTVSHCVSLLVSTGADATLDPAFPIWPISSPWYAAVSSTLSCPH